MSEKANRNLAVRVAVAETQGYRRVRLHERVLNPYCFSDPVASSMYVDGGEFEYLVPPDWKDSDVGVRAQIGELRIACDLPDWERDPPAWGALMEKERVWIVPHTHGDGWSGFGHDLPHGFMAESPGAAVCRVVLVLYGIDWDTLEPMR